MPEVGRLKMAAYKEFKESSNTLKGTDGRQRVTWDNNTIGGKLNGSPNPSQRNVHRIKILSKRTNHILRHMRGAVPTPSH